MAKEKLIVIKGNVNRKIWNAKTGAVLKCSSPMEAHTVHVMAKRVDVDTSIRNSQVVFHSEIDRDKYLWVSGEPAKKHVEPSLRSVE